MRDFSEIYDTHVWQVYGFFAYRLHVRADAEDLTQRTFERALRSWGRYDPSRASVSTWLLAIARNLLIDHFRADRGERELPLGELAADDPALRLSSEQSGLGVEAGLERALAALSDRERELVALRFGGDLTGPEIAEMTGLSLANVQQILSRALRRMRSQLEQPSQAGPTDS